MYRRIFGLSVLIIALLSVNGLSQTLDPSFGNSGVVLKNLYYGSAFPQSSVVLPDGKIIVLTSSFDYQTAFALHRFSANGFTDSSFGNKGEIDYPISLGTRYGNMVSDSMGRLFVLGMTPDDFYDDSTHNVVREIRLDENGAIDSTFGKNGVLALRSNSFPSVQIACSNGEIAIAGSGPYRGVFIMKIGNDGSFDSVFNAHADLTNYPNPGYTNISGIAEQTDHSLILAATTNIYVSKDLIHLFTDGKPDTTFGNNGVASVSLDSYPISMKVGIFPDQKILVSGTVYAEGVHEVYFAELFKPNGHPDSSFNKTSIILGTSIKNGYSVNDGFLIRPDKKVILFNSMWQHDSSIVLYSGINEDGTPDSSFADDGTLSIYSPVGVSPDFELHDLEKDGAIVNVGEYQHAGRGDPGLFKLNANGSVDISFGINGYFFQPVGQSADYLTDMSVLSDGSVIVLGEFFTQSASGFALSKFNADGEPDLSFATQGTFIDTTTNLNIENQPFKEFILPDNKILVVGWHTDDLSGHEKIELLLSRFKSNGVPDSTFGVNGYAFYDHPVSWYIPNDAIVLSNGKIIVVGFAASGSNSFTDIIQQYNSNGLPDSTFGINGQLKIYPDKRHFTFQNVVMDSTGHLIIGGFNTYNTKIATRLLPGEKVDTTFGIRGYAKKTDSIGGYLSLKFVQPDGKLVFEGRDMNYHYYVARYDASGFPDSTFNGTGFSCDCKSKDSIITFAITYAANKRYYLSGYTLKSAHLWIASLDSSGHPDSSFGINGELILQFAGAEYGQSIKALSDGSLLVGGSVSYLYDTAKFEASDLMLVKIIAPVATGTMYLPQAVNSLLVYPTPLHHFTTVELQLAKSDDLNFKLFDEDGRMVEQWNNVRVSEGKVDVPLNFSPQLSRGWYTLQVKGLHFNTAVKIIVQ